MFTLYVICLIFGGVLIGISIFTGTESDVDLDAGSSFEMDGLDADVDVDVEGGAGGEGVVAAARFISLRNFVFFTAFFGLTGTLFTVLRIPYLVTLFTAIGFGVAAGILMQKVMDYLKSSEVGEQLDLRDIEGHPAKVLVEISREWRGKVAVEQGGRTIRLLAMVYDNASRDSFRAGETVTVVSVREGTAFVADEHFIG